MLAVADGPPGVKVPLTSAGTSYRVNVAEPVVVLGGSTTIAYVPALGRVRASMKPPPVPKNEFPPTDLPSGPTIDAVADENVTDVIFTLTRCPALALKVSRPFCPGVVVEIEAGGPPGVIAPPASGGTLYRVNVADPVAAPWGSITIAYCPMVGSVV